MPIYATHVLYWYTPWRRTSRNAVLNMFALPLGLMLLNIHTYIHYWLIVQFSFSLSSSSLWSNISSVPYSLHVTSPARYGLVILRHKFRLVNSLHQIVANIDVERIRNRTSISRWNHIHKRPALNKFNQKWLQVGP